MSESSAPAFTWERRVEFAETDAAGICHFSSFFIFMEQAEHALFRHCGMSIFPQSHSNPRDVILTWPRVQCSCEYRAPALFEETLHIDVYIERIGTKSMSYRHVIRRSDQVLAVGTLVAVCCSVDPVTHAIASCEIPEDIRKKFESLKHR